MPVEVVTPSLQDIVEAAEVKAWYPIASADAFAAQLAVKRKAPLVTGDPEFRMMADLTFVWLAADSL